MLTHYIGQIRAVRFPFYNTQTSLIEYKMRPCLIIGKENINNRCDITVLPVSKISNRSNVHVDNDIQVISSQYANLNLNENESFIRCGKITTVHSSDISNNVISSLKNSYPDLYAQIRDTFQNFSTTTLFQ